MSTGKPSFDAQAMWAELKANRQTQAALVVFVVILTWMLWPDAPKTRRTTTGASGNTFVDPKALASLRKLPDLAALDQAGEIPAIPKLLRDPFLFEAPKPPPPPPKPVKVEPPPPKTQAQIDAELLDQQKKDENNSRPQDLRYLGFLKGSPAGQIGAFMKGEEAQPLTLGTQVKDRWKLVELTDRKAVFQNTRFGDLRFELVTRDAAGGSAPGAGTVTNEY
jgi:type IV secretory pathway VirB10-like protein